MPRIASIIGRFPEHELAIRRFCNRDSEFLCVCEDHGEAAAALDRFRLANDEMRVDEYRQILADLELEILEGIDKRTVPVRAPVNDRVQTDRNDDKRE